MSLENREASIHNTSIIQYCKMSESSRTTTLKTQLLLLLLLATSITARKTARDLKNVFDEPVFSGIPNNATEDGDRYIVVFTDGSLEFLNRLIVAEANEEDDGDRVVRNLSARSTTSNIKSNIKHHKVEKRIFSQVKCRNYSCSYRRRSRRVGNT